MGSLPAPRNRGILPGRIAEDARQNMSIRADIERDTRLAQEAMRRFEIACRDFRDACERFDWAAAETARETALAILDGYFDLLGAAYKRLDTI